MLRAYKEKLGTISQAKKKNQKDLGQRERQARSLRKRRPKGGKYVIGGEGKLIKRSCQHTYKTVAYIKTYGLGGIFQPPSILEEGSQGRGGGSEWIERGRRKNCWGGKEENQQTKKGKGGGII